MIAHDLNALGPLDGGASSWRRCLRRWGVPGGVRWPPWDRGGSGS